MGSGDGRRRVLYVDGDPTVAGDVQSTLTREHEHLEVATATDAELATAHIAEQPVDCIVCVADLPDGDGVALFERVREEHGEIPFILSTSPEASDLLRNATDAGVTDFILNSSGSPRYEDLATRINVVTAADRARRNASDPDSALEALEAVNSPSGRSFDERLEWALQCGCEYLDLPYGALSRIDSTGTEGSDEVLMIVSARSPDGSVRPGDSVALSRTHCRQTVVDRTLLAIEDTSAATGGDDAPADAFDLGCYVGNPVHVDERTYGTLWFGSDHPRKRVFSGPERAFVRLLSTWLGDEIECRHALGGFAPQLARQESIASIVSHDLRNPLTVVNGRIELASREMESEHLDAVERSLVRLDSLIEGVVRLAREGEQVSRIEPVSVQAAAESIWEAIAADRGELVVDTDRTIRADRKAFEQVLEYLFENAIEHNGGEPTVTIGELEDGLYVEDDGDGIPEEERIHVVDFGFSTKSNAAGIGLGIARRLCEEHRWELEVTEGDAGGARFELLGVDRVGD